MPRIVGKLYLMKGDRSAALDSLDAAVYAGRTNALFQEEIRFSRD
jgi:hypothetical protein